MGVPVDQDVRLGIDARVISYGDDGLEMESFRRLRPGRPLRVCLDERTGAPRVRHGILQSWRLTRVDPGAPVYQGFCRWQDDG